MLSDDVLSIIENYDNLIYISSESIKEFIHLVQTGKVAGKRHNITLDIFDFIENELGYSIKYVTKEHLRTMEKLDLVEKHNDPNDRLIIAQAITEKIPLISSDTKFPKYTKFGLDFIPN